MQFRIELHHINTQKIVKHQVTKMSFKFVNVYELKIIHFNCLHFYYNKYLPLSNASKNLINSN